MQYEVKIKKLPKSEVELEVSLPADFLEDAKKKAIKNFCISLELPGFRKGHVPENVVIEKVGEGKILEEAVDFLLKEHFPKIVSQEKLDIIGRPKISVTKLAEGNPFEFKASFAVMPEIELPEYKKIAGDVNKKTKPTSAEATAGEVEDVLLQIRKNKAHLDYHKTHQDEKDRAHSGLNLEDEKNLPPLDDELAKAAGNFKNLDELREKVKQNLEAEKKFRNNEKKRAAIMDALLEETKIDLPDVLVEHEIEKSMAQMKADVERAGSKFEDYLSHIKKTAEELRKDFRESSEKRAAIQLIFNKIAEEEKLEPNKEILENEVKEVLKHYPETNEQNARIYVTTILLNSEVLKLLENQ